VSWRFLPVGGGVFPGPPGPPGGRCAGGAAVGVPGRGPAPGRSRAGAPPGSRFPRWTMFTVMATGDTAKPPALRAVRTGAGLGGRPGAAPSAGSARGPAAEPATGDGARAGLAAAGTADESGHSQLSWVIANHVRSRRREI